MTQKPGLDFEWDQPIFRCCIRMKKDESTPGRELLRVEKFPCPLNRIRSQVYSIGVECGRFSCEPPHFVLQELVKEGPGQIRDMPPLVDLPSAKDIRREWHIQLNQPRSTLGKRLRRHERTHVEDH